MYIKHCKLSRSEQLDLMKYFVAGSTARTAADLRICLNGLRKQDEFGIKSL